MRRLLSAQSPNPKTKPYVASKTPWGDPDLQGTYTNKDENGIPFERPKQFAGKTNADVDDAGTGEHRQAAREAAVERAPGIGGAEPGAGPMHWFENYGAKNSRAWLVVDPPDGTRSAAQRLKRAHAPRRARLRRAAHAAPPTVPRTAACTTAASPAACPVR